MRSNGFINKRHDNRTSMTQELKIEVNCTMMDGMNRFIPKCTRWPVNSKKNLQPFTADLRHLVHRKHRLWNRWITTKNVNVFDEYKIVRNKVKQETVKLVQQEQDKISRDCKSNPKRFWRYVNRTRGQSNLTKRASRGAHSPVRGHPRGSKLRKLYHWIPGVGFPISVP